MIKKLILLSSLSLFVIGCGGGSVPEYQIRAGVDNSRLQEEFELGAQATCGERPPEDLVTRNSKGYNLKGWSICREVKDARLNTSDRQLNNKIDHFIDVQQEQFLNSPVTPGGSAITCIEPDGKIRRDADALWQSSNDGRVIGRVNEDGTIQLDEAYQSGRVLQGGTRQGCN